MIQKLIRWIGQHRLIAIAAGALVVFAGAFLIWWGSQPGKPGVQTIPLQGNGSTTTGSISNPGGKIVQTSIRLSEGQAQPQAVTPITLVPGTPLSPDEIRQILTRLPALPVVPANQTDFKLPTDPIPPPRPGVTVPQLFPPVIPVGPVVPVESGPLEVLRFSPEGEIPIAPFIDITFNQPMVALTTIADLAASQVPVRVEPPLAGTWRWLGTRTLNFQYDSTLIDRLPKATRYHVTIPPGTTSATGGILAKAVEWDFTTPPPKVTLTYPDNGPQSRTPLFFIHFDQRIDPAAVLKTIRVTAGGHPASLELVSAAALKADKKLNDLLRDAKEGRWLAFQAKETLPADTDVSVAIGPGTPSAEGPLLTKAAQSYSFRTYAALHIDDYGCNYGSKNPCPPLSPFYIRFNNPIDDSVYTGSLLRIDPELPGATVNIYGNTINIQGATKGQTTYTVTVSKDIRDTFGQTLGQDAQLTFQVGQAEPMLSGPQSTFITLDPAAKKPVFSVYTINLNALDVEIYAVQPADWLNFKAFYQKFQQSKTSTTPPGRQVLKKSLPVESPADTLNEVDIDLASLMDGSFGQFIVLVSPPQSLLKSSPNRHWQKVAAWVQVTQIGLDAYNDQSDMVVWTSALKNGAPLAGVAITAGPSGGQVATTGPDGTARLAIPAGTSYLVATQGADQAILPHSPYPWGDQGWATRSVSDELRWYVFDDRQMYRPGEEVHFKGWLRRIGGGPNGDVGLVGSLVNGVNYQIKDSRGNALGSGRANVNTLGGFDFVFKLPDALNLGYTTLSLTAEGSLGGMSRQQFNHSFQVQEFRTPEFEVTARNESSGPYFSGGQAVVAVDAKYYAGGGLPNAGVTWQVTSSPGQYSPPNWPDFTFGVWTPWWEKYNFGFGGRVSPPGPGRGDTKAETFTGKTDSNGTHYLQLSIDAIAGLKPVSVIAEASVMDVNRQSWASRTTLLVHPASVYVGLRSDKIFVDRGTPLKVDFIVTDLDGKPALDRPVEVRAARLEWKYRSGSWQEVEADLQTCSKGSQAGPVTCEFSTPVGGTYRITATVSDKLGRQNQSQFTRWVSGGKLPPARSVEQEQVTLIPDKQTYQPGDVARILVQAPFGASEGLLTIDRSGIVSTRRFTIQDTTITLEVPINEKSIPNLNLQVDLNGSAPRTGDQGEALPGVDPRPAFATARLTLSVPPQQRTLALTVSPEQPELEPGGETTLRVNVKDAAGRPVSGAEVTVVVVDEAILALSNAQSPDPLGTFYTNSPSAVSSIYARSSIILANPQALGQGSAKSLAVPTAAPRATMAVGMAAPQATRGLAESSAGMDAQSQQPIRVRTNFNPLAMFAANERTDANGAVQVTVKLPDNLTRYRVMVVAVDQSGRQFGESDSNLVARLPLMVRPSAPRFLNFGDTFELPVVLQNQTNQPLTVDVAVRADNILLTGSQGMRVTVPARDRVEVRFPSAAQMAGTARLQIAAVSGSATDAATVELPVYTPATTEAFATYGVIDRGAVAQPVAAPNGVFPQYGGLEITTSSTALQALTDAVLYLQSYPYECSEQLSSRILAISALRDVLTAFQAKGLPSPAEMELSVERDIARLAGLQNGDGGFPYWVKGKESIPFNTIHAAHALYQAGAKGYTVPSDMQQRALEYLRQIETHYPGWYGQHTRQTLSAYALYVRSLLGDRDPQKALKLIKDTGLENLPMEAIGWLWPVLKDTPSASAQVDAIRRFVNNHTVETAGAANFTTGYDEQSYLLLSSDRRTDAILLDALIADSPQSDLIPKLVNGLLAHRTQGRWGSTQENVFVLLALDHYFNTYEAQTPDFVAQIWLGPTYAGRQQFSGRSTDRNQTNIPMSYLVDPTLGGGGTQDLVLSKDGTGRLYYRLGLTYAPTDLNLKPLDMGFVVTRTYEAVDDPGDVSRDRDGVWHIKAGARVRVHLTMVAGNRRYHVALTDPLPAGLEIINPALAVSGSTPQDPNSPDYRYGWWWWGTWYEHQNLRAERAEAFTSLLWDGVYQYTYTARATTPGRFIVPPAKAEEMYSPEVFGRSGSNVVIVQ